MGRKSLSEIEDKDRARMLAWVRALPPEMKLSGVARSTGIPRASLEKFRGFGILGPSHRAALKSWMQERKLWRRAV